MSVVGRGSHLNINGVTLVHPFLDLFDHIGCVAIKNFEVRDAVFREERSGHSTVEPARYESSHKSETLRVCPRTHLHIGPSELNTPTPSKGSIIFPISVPGRDLRKCLSIQSGVPMCTFFIMVEVGRKNELPKSRQRTR
jgi:hypothetical protein